MKAYKVTVYTTDMEGKTWHRGAEYYYTTEEKAKAKAEAVYKKGWVEAKVEAITVEE